MLRERKPDRRLDTNVEFHTALLLHGLGLPSALFTPIFAVGRVLGWAADCLEPRRDGRLIRRNPPTSAPPAFATVPAHELQENRHVVKEGQP